MTGGMETRPVVGEYLEVTYDVEMAGPASSFSAAFAMSPGGG